MGAPSMTKDPGTSCVCSGIGVSTCVSDAVETLPLFCTVVVIVRTSPRCTDPPPASVIDVEATRHGEVSSWTLSRKLPIPGSVEDTARKANTVDVWPGGTEYWPRW